MGDHFGHPQGAQVKALNSELGLHPLNGLVAIKKILNFVLGPPSPRGVPGEGPECRFPMLVWGRFLHGSGVANIFSIFMMTLSAARMNR